MSRRYSEAMVSAAPLLSRSTSQSIASNAPMCRCGSHRRNYNEKYCADFIRALEDCRQDANGREAAQRQKGKEGKK
jgi:hypothetical protein